MALNVPVTAHLVRGRGARRGHASSSRSAAFVPDDSDDRARSDRDGRGWTAPSVAAWTEPRTLLIGVFVLAFAFTEGTGIDWINVAVIDDYGAPGRGRHAGVRRVPAAMTTGRWFGPRLLDRYGRVPVLRVLAVCGLAGLALFVFGRHPAVAFAGAVLWGVGASLGFPVGMSAASDDPARGPARVSVVASIGYCAFLGGPPLIGFLGDQVTVRTALLAVAVLLIVSIVIAGAIRPLQR